MSESKYELKAIRKTPYGAIMIDIINNALDDIENYVVDLDEAGSNFLVVRCEDSGFPGIAAMYLLDEDIFTHDWKYGTLYPLENFSHIKTNEQNILSLSKNHGEFILGDTERTNILLKACKDVYMEYVLLS